MNNQALMLKLQNAQQLEQTGMATVSGSISIGTDSVLPQNMDSVQISWF